MRKPSSGYLVRPANATKLPSVLVIHENRGLNPYSEDVARRLAVANFIAFAPDGLTPVGGYPGDDEKAAALFGKIDGSKMREDFFAAATWLKSRPDSTGKLGAIGFCFGGGIVNQLAVRMGSDLAAAVPYYGVQPSAADTAKIKAPINAQYGELDTRITGGWPAFDAAFTEAQVPHEGHIYKCANHGFHNDTTTRYDEAAELAAYAGLVQQVPEGLNRRRRSRACSGAPPLAPRSTLVLASFAKLACPREKRHLMGRSVHDVPLVPEVMLRAIAMMHVEVDDESRTASSTPTRATACRGKSQEPRSLDSSQPAPAGAPLWVKMVVGRAVLSEAFARRPCSTPNSSPARAA